MRRKVLDDFAAAFEHVDAILTPTTPTSAAFAASAERDGAAAARLPDAVAAFLADAFTVPASLAGGRRCVGAGPGSAHAAARMLTWAGD